MAFLLHIIYAPNLIVEYGRLCPHQYVFITLQKNDQRSICETIKKFIRRSTVQWKINGDKIDASETIDQATG